MQAMNTENSSSSVQMETCREEIKRRGEGRFVQTGPDKLDPKLLSAACHTTHTSLGSNEKGARHMTSLGGGIKSPTTWSILPVARARCICNSTPAIPWQC